MSISRERELPVTRADNQLTAIEAETTVITNRAIAVAQIRCLFVMTVARVRAELTMGIVGRILLPESLLEWRDNKLYIDIVKCALKCGTLVDIGGHCEPCRKTDDLHLNAIHVDTKK